MGGDGVGQMDEGWKDGGILLLHFSGGSFFGWFSGEGGVLQRLISVVLCYGESSGIVGLGGGGLGWPDGGPKVGRLLLFSAAVLFRRASFR